MCSQTNHCKSDHFEYSGCANGYTHSKPEFQRVLNITILSLLVQLRKWENNFNSHDEVMYTQNLIHLVLHSDATILTVNHYFLE